VETSKKRELEEEEVTKVRDIIIKKSEI